MKVMSTFYWLAPTISGSLRDQPMSSEEQVRLLMSPPAVKDGPFVV